LTQQAAAIAAGEMSSVELVTQALAAAERVQPALNSFTHILAEDAIRRAAEADASPPRGPLHGVPIAVKDLYDVEGLASTGCCAAYEDRPSATADSAVVAKLRDAGAIVIAMRGKMKLATEIAISSSAQVALLIAPVLVFAGLAFGQPMDLAFSTFEVVAVALAVSVANTVVRDAESNWLEGAFLLLVYGMLAVAFFYF